MHCGSRGSKEDGVGEVLGRESLEFPIVFCACVTSVRHEGAASNDLGVGGGALLWPSRLRKLLCRRLGLSGQSALERGLMMPVGGKCTHLHNTEVTKQESVPRS